MSTCISREGEFGSHTLDELHTCKRCHVLVEDALRAELSQLRAELVMLRADEEHSNSDIERLNGEVLRAWAEVRHRDKQLDLLAEQRDQVLAHLDEIQKMGTFPGGDFEAAAKWRPADTFDAIRAIYAASAQPSNLEAQK